MRFVLTPRPIPASVGRTASVDSDERRGPTASADSDERRGRPALSQVLSTVATLAVVLALALTVMTACGGGTGSSGPNPDGSGAIGAGAGGSLVITGSSTVEPIVNLLAEDFSATNPDVAIAVSGPGSGDGHKAACDGDIPIWNSSRQITDSEAECLAEASIEFIELRVGIDGITVITAASNDTVGCLTFQDLYSLIGIESTGFSRWEDANTLNTELGGPGAFSDVKLDIFAPGEESGTFDSFAEIALEDIWESRTEQGKVDDDYSVRPDYNAGANDNVIIDGVAGNEYSLGWVGFAFADASRDRIRLLPIDGGNGCVEPSPQTITSAQFPISRYLYTYVNIDLADAPAVAQFIDYYLSDEGQVRVVDAGYVNVSAADLAKSRNNWQNRIAGSNFGIQVDEYSG